MKASILSVGDELVQGEIQDTNAPFLATELGEMGVRVLRIVQVGDDREALVAEIGRLASSSDTVLITGGLGPTKDDITREAVAEATGRKLVLNEEILLAIEERFHYRGLEMPESNRRQAFIPQGAEVLRNPLGTAGGFLLEWKGCWIAVLPGVPREMKAMWREELRARLEERVVTEGVLIIRRLKCFGAPESWIGERIGDLMKPESNPKVGLLASGGVITVKFVACGVTPEDAEVAAAKAKEEVRKRLGSVVFGEDDVELEDVVARLLEEKNTTLAFAESCTGGLLCASITNVPGISRFFMEGVVAYSNEAKTKILGVPKELIAEHGAVSEQVARAMGEGVRSLSGAELGVGVTGIAGPSGGTPEKPVGVVFVALASEEGSVVRRFQFRGERNFIRDLARKSALNLIRLKLVGELQ